MVVEDIHRERLDTCGKEGQYPRRHSGKDAGGQGCR
jgi:hypothetical protein